MNRRDFLTTAALAGGAAMAGLGVRGALGADTPTAAKTLPSVKDLARKVPRWRGFNLLEKFMVGRNSPFVEADFEWIEEWGFDWVRLPMDYRCWTDKDDPYKLDEKVLKEIDEAVAFGKKHKVHVNVCLHRAPGYTVASPPEKLNLWKDAEAQKQFAFQWAAFAKRYKGLPSTEVSFDLVNEPDDKVSPPDYAKVARQAVEAIRAADPDRLVVSDGLKWGRVPVMELADLGIAQSTRGYEPFHLTHYRANWVNSTGWAEPEWPMKEGDKPLDRAWLKSTCIDPWKVLEAKGCGVHVGEWGAFNKTPHAAVLACVAASYQGIERPGETESGHVFKPRVRISMSAAIAASMERLGQGGLR